jgi:hypothetical protein
VYSFFHIRHTTGWLGLRSGLACGRVNLLLGKAQHERDKMARWTKCNHCGFMVDNYSDTAEQDWNNHTCIEEGE